MKNRETLSTLGTVYALSVDHNKGQIRLIDNRRAQFDFAAIFKGSPIPKLKDEVSVEIISTQDGLVAISLRVTEKTSAILNDIRINVAPEKKLPLKKNDVKKSRDLTDFLSISKEPTERRESSQKVYEKAVIARAEGRVAEARILFEKAISTNADVPIYTAYFKMLAEGAGKDITRAREVMKLAITSYPMHADFYVMFGHLERRVHNFSDAVVILRNGLQKLPTHPLISTGLAQVLSQIGTTESLKEAGKIFSALEAIHKLNKSDRTYMRFRALTANPQAAKTYSFFDSLPGFSPALPGKKDLPAGISDLVVDIKDRDLKYSFGIHGTYLIRCFSTNPKRSDILELSRYLRSLKSDATVGLINGREALLNSSLAFVAIPRTSGVRDFLMSVLSENNEAILPIDEQLLEAGSKSRDQLQEIFSQYLGVRDLYDSTLPVSGRRLFGRERLLVELADQVHKGEFIGVFGLRKMGKTSLMYQLRDEKLKDEAVAYVDLQASPGLAIGSFSPVLWEIERDLVERLAPRFPSVKDILRLGRFSRYSDAALSGVSPALLFAEDIREFLDAIIAKKFPGITRLVIILDELERCLPLAGQPAMAGYLEFFGLLRGLAQTERYRNIISSVVVAANASISEKGYWEGRENPVFSLYKTLFLPPLSKPDTRQMIQSLGKGMSVYWTEKAVDEIYDECGGHPFLTRVLCSQICKKMVQRPLQVSDVLVRQEAPLFIQDKSDKFEQITELLHAHFPEEEKFLDRLAMGIQSDSISDESIRHLIGYQLISRVGGKYSISLNALNSWLRRRAGVK